MEEMISPVAGQTVVRLAGKCWAGPVKTPQRMMRNILEMNRLQQRLIILQSTIKQESFSD